LPWDQSTETLSTDLNLNNNFCRNQKDSSTDNIRCLGFTNPEQELEEAFCPIPRCSEMKNLAKNKFCKIKSVAPIDREKFKIYDEEIEANVTWNGDCYFGSNSDGYDVLNPRRCYERMGFKQYI
jgi:hypothetical protein